MHEIKPDSSLIGDLDTIGQFATEYMETWIGQIQQNTHHTNSKFAPCITDGS